MDPITSTMLISSIDHTLASVRAALAAGKDPEQLDEARTKPAEQAAAGVARLVVSSQDPSGGDVPQEVTDGIRRAGKAANGGDLQSAEAGVAAAREQLGGPSR